MGESHTVRLTSDNKILFPFYLFFLFILFFIYFKFIIWQKEEQFNLFHLTGLYQLTVSL